MAGGARKLPRAWAIILRSRAPRSVASGLSVAVNAERYIMEAKRLDGWQFWVRDAGRLRTFIVAFSDFAEAQAKAVAQTSGGSVVSYRQTPKSLIPYLQLPGEEVAELVSVDPAREPVPAGTLLNEAANGQQKERSGAP